MTQQHTFTLSRKEVDTILTALIHASESRFVSGLIPDDEERKSVDDLFMRLTTQFPYEPEP